MVILDVTEVKLADRIYTNSLLAQPVVPAGDPAVVGEGVVPATGLVHPSPRGETGTGRHTDRAVRVGSIESRPAPGELI